MSDTSKKSVNLAPTPILTISGHEDTVFRVTYLAGGKRLVTCSYDKTVRIWNAETGEQEGTSMEHDSWIEGLGVTRDEKIILSGGDGKGLRIWDMETHQLVGEWPSDEGVIRCIAISPNGDLVASGHGQGGIIVREMDGGTIKYSLKSGSGDVIALCFSPDGTKLACGGDQAVRVFDVDSGDLILGPIEGHTNHVFSIVWSLDGSRLFTSSSDQTIRHWDSESGEAIGEPWMGHTDYVKTISLSPDGTKLTSVSRDKTVRFWDADSGNPTGELVHHEGHMWAVTFSPSGEFVACSGEDKKVSIWRVPWWDDRTEKHKSFLDLPAVTVPGPTATHLDRQFDYLDLPTNRRPSSPRSRMHTNNTHSSPSSWRPWRTLPHRLFGRLRLPPRRAGVTTVYPGILQQRVYVASRDDESATETPTEPLPTAPGHYARFSIIVESVSSSDSLDGDQATSVAPQDNSEPVQASCCSFFSRRRGRSGTASSPPAAMELTQRVSPTPNVPSPPLAASSHTSTQNVLDLPAVVELPPGMA
ncbi:hypothetical protein PAXINDRAFT_170195 [Paxillus involutus ATCC 200175]|uniref:WD40 repeat-like protein n=1 Tax=Paxillus involutus ATCC 200175 TaxID=664439 RepID=A0A0C9SW63_PAXIN|nr:hypothetical protein PAXINDRAFT_170195 [Paxillus involutus ATCC 200175]